MEAPTNVAPFRNDGNAEIATGLGCPGAPEQVHDQLVNSRLDYGTVLSDRPSRCHGSPRPWVEKLDNGELLAQAEAAGFQVLVTTEKNLRYQQNLADRKIAIVVPV
jgi:hypothetical protein